MSETADTTEQKKEPAAESPPPTQSQTKAPPPVRAAVPPSYVWGKEPYLLEKGIPDLADNAAKHIADWVTGNGLTAADVRVATKKQDIFAFDIPISLQLVPTVIESHTPGQSRTGTQCTSKQEMQEKIAALKAQNLSDPKTVILVGEYLKKAPMLGWGSPQRFPLKELGADYTCHETCPKCKGKKQQSCGYCKGKGQTPCMDCKGMGKTNCLRCMALGELPGPDGSKIKCPECLGKKQAVCRECRGLKYMPCPKCRGAKYVGCTDCNKTGYVSLHNSVAFEASTNMSVSTASMPAEIRDLLEATGGEAKLATEQHAAISMVMPDPETLDALTAAAATTNTATTATATAAQNTAAGQPAAQAPQAELHYHVEIPYGTAEFSIGGKRYDAQLAGYQSCILHIDNFLDPLVKSGIAALQKIVKGPMATEALMKTAMKLRLVKDVFSHTGSMTKKKMLQHVKTLYPRGLSDKYAKACVVFADQAIKSLTDKPRKIGAAVGTTIASALAGGWFFGGLRGMALTAETPANEQMIYDFTLAGALAVTAYFTVRFFGASALKKIMSFQGGGGKQALPPGGMSGMLAGIITLVIFFAMALLMPEPPGWF